MTSCTTGLQAAGFSDEGKRVVLRLSDGRTVDGDVLVAADGVGSPCGAS